ncbi:F-box/kelch-repeat protein At2g44130-like [Impatiens glandulifera]|uniref:F-box/kelch-repeat protein At2g44130-like n=1 Tax=Impatiens glandulifera TaxID=253017 RepID=UPI001FB12BCA|nr:F-box/kelch-repeat protein At2g44130-like [Impatiens glandulifera]
MEEHSIHSLSEDLLLQCLARLSYKDILFASRVCRKWRRLLQTRHFYSLRKQLGYSNHLACFFQSSHPPPTMHGFYKYCEYKFVINVLDPMSREWNQLPPIPNFINEFSESTLMASLDGKLFFVTKCSEDSHLTSSFFAWDFVTQRWWKGKDLPSISSFFFMVGFDSQIFIGVAKGNGSISVLAYDVRKDEWNELPQMSHKLNRCYKLQVIGEELWVLNGCKTKLIPLYEHSAAVYHLQTGNWRLVEWDPDDSSCPICCTEFKFPELLELLKELLLELNINYVLSFSRFQLGAQSLIMVTVNGGYARETLFFMGSQYGNFERILPLRSEFLAFVESSCCVEI